jgi:uncharacterized membrane protein YiaA
MSMQGDKANDSMFAALCVVEHSLIEGLSEFSATALAEVTLDNRERAYRYGQLALTMSAELKCTETEIASVSLLCITVLNLKLFTASNSSPA